METGQNGPHLTPGLHYGIRNSRYYHSGLRSYYKSIRQIIIYYVCFNKSRLAHLICSKREQVLWTHGLQQLYSIFFVAFFVFVLN